jgi:hypothetical protein
MTGYIDRFLQVFSDSPGRGAEGTEKTSPAPGSLGFLGIPGEESPDGTPSHPDRSTPANVGPAPPSETPAPSPSPGAPRAAVAGPPIPAEGQGAPLDGHWRPAIACWPVEWRQRWADRAEAHHTAGCDRLPAEYRAWRETLRELDQAEARRERIDHQEPVSGLSDKDALRQIEASDEGQPQRVGPNMVMTPHGPREEVVVTKRGPRDVRRGDKWHGWHWDRARDTR